MKKLNLLLLLIFSVISLNISAHDFEAVNSDGKTIYYNVISSADLTVEVTYKGSYSDDYNEYAGEITIPLSVTYNGETYSVTSIGDNAFRGCSGLTSVTIPNSVTSIGSWAFEGCSGLTSVTIPNSVTLIGIYAFSGCSGLTSVTIPNSVTSIENWAFEGCSGLTSVTIPNSVTTIRGSAFWGCSGLTSVTIPNSVTLIEIYAFWGCSGLTSVTIPNSVTSIGKYAFMHCSGLTSVTIPNSVTLIGERAFLGCSGLTSVTIPNSVTSIGGDAFYGCSGLKELTLEDGDEKLSFGSDVFDETPLESVYLGRSLSDASSASSSLFYSNRTTLTSLTIGNSVTSIGDYAFYDCSGLTSVTIPNSVTSIGRSAFRGCSGLTSVTIPNSVTSIGKYAFEGCSGLTSVTIPNSVTSIGDDAFFDCSGLTSLTIGNSVTTIGSSAFWGCSGLTSVIIPNSVTSIGEGAFEDCSGLTSVTIPNSVTSIGDYAFYGCSGLKELTLEDGDEKLSFGSDVFDETPLESVYLGRSLSDASSASSSLFYSNRTTLTSLTIGDSVTSIGERAFSACSGLTSVTIPNSVTSIGSDAFSGCSGLTSVTIGNSVTSIGNGAFWSCSGLTSVTIPNSVTSIGDYAFEGCRGLTSVTIPNSVTSIGIDAYDGCSGLKELTIEDGEETLSFGSGVFYDCPLESLYLGRNISYDTNSLSLNGDLLTTDLSSTDRTNIEKTDIAEQAYCISTAIQQNSGNGAGHYLRGFTLSDGTSSIEITDIQPTPLSPIYSDKTSYILTTSPGATLSISVVDMARPEWMHAYVFIDYDNDKEFNQTTNSDGTTGGEVVSFNYYNGSNSKGQTGITENCKVLASNIPSWTLPTDLQLGEYRLRFKIDWNSIDPCGAANIVADNGCIVDVTIVVAETGYSPFYNKTTLKTLTIGNSVKSLGNYAFAYCSGLTSLTIGNSVKSLGNYAFSGCRGLTSVTIGNGVTSIGNSAFSYCRGLTSVTIGNSVTSIDDYAFLGCRELKQLTIEDGEDILSFGLNVFDETPLESVYLGRSLSDASSASSSLFYNNRTTLSSLTIGNSVKSLGNYAFSGCRGLTSVTIGNGLTSIGNSAFSYCRGLTSVTIGNSVTSIDDYAFLGCRELKQLTIEDGEEKLSFGSNVFDETPLESVYLGRSLSDASSASSSLFYNNRTTLTSLTIGNSVKSLGNYAFYGFSGLTSLTIGNSVKSLGNYAFSGCSGLKELTIEDGEEKLSFGSDVFDETPLESVYLGRSLSDASSASSSLFYNNRTTLSSLTIGNSVKSLGNYAFYGFSGLTSLTIGNSVKSLGNYAFSNCTGLTSVVIPNGLNTIGDYCFDSCSELKSLTLGSSLTIIGNSAFSSCAKLAVVTLPESLKTIGDSAFKGCSGLRLLSIPNGVNSIGSYAFDGCSGIRSIIIGNSVESIGEYAFNGSSKFVTITIPSSVTSIGNGVFNGCSGLKDLTIEDSEDILSLGTNGLGDGLFNDSPLENVYLGRDIACDNSPFKNKTTLTSLTIGYCVTTIDDAIFSGCSGLKDLTIEYCNEVLSLGRNDEDEGLFYDCPLESLYLGRDLSYDISSEYGYSPFYNKESLSSLIVGSSVTAIGCGLFEECSGLTEIYSLSSIPAVCDVLPFWGVDKTIPVYIPFGSKSAYKSASEWKNFKNFIESEFTGVEEEEISTSDIKVISGNGVEINDYYGRIRIVNLAGQVIKDVYVNGSIQISLPKGIYIVVTENNSQKVIL